MNNKLDMKTASVAQGNIEKIRQLFPDAVTEVNKDGKTELAIDFDVLKQELSESLIDEGKERYQMTWPGKKQAVVLANTSTTDTLRPCKEESVDFDNTQNLYIEGDNLNVLKLLHETYLGKIKMIYIDPPYNTGNDFIYNDDFAMESGEWRTESGDFDEQGNRLVKNLESNGRFHTDWLNMLYPRLRLARDLLTDDGIIFISIGEQEVHNLKKIAIEIFGASNFIETYIWESTFRPDNSSKIMRRNAEYVMCFAKNITNITHLTGEIKTKEGLPSLTKASMKESVLKFPKNTVKTLLADGIYKKGVRDSYELIDDVEVKNGIIVNEFRLKGRMIWGQEYLEKELSNGTEIIIKSDGFVPYTKKSGDSIMSPTKIIPNTIVGDILSANTEFSKLFDTKIFSYPKPVSLVKYLLHYLDDKNFIVLDFFSGSATTAHAVMQLNAEDGGNRKFIMVQLPEKCDEKSEAYKAGYKNICEIGKERIRRAGTKIVEERAHLLNAVKSGAFEKGKPFAQFTNSESAKAAQAEIRKTLDIGFRVLKLDSSNMQDVYYNPAAVSQTLLDATIDNIKPDRTPLDLLFQVMLELGVPLSAKIEENVVNGKTYYAVNGNDIIACFDDDIDEEVITAIAKQQPLYAVFKDQSFASDSVAINNEQLFKTYSPATVIKVI